MGALYGLRDTVFPIGLGNRRILPEPKEIFDVPFRFPHRGVCYAHDASVDAVNELESSSMTLT